MELIRRSSKLAVSYVKGQCHLLATFSVCIVQSRDITGTFPLLRNFFFFFLVLGHCQGKNCSLCTMIKSTGT